MNIRYLILISLLQLSAVSVCADNSVTPTGEAQAGSSRQQALLQVQNQLRDTEHRWYGLMRLRWSYPQKLSAGFGMILAEQPRDSDCSTGCMMRGWHFEVEPGLYGVQGSVGWGNLVGETGRTERLLHTIYYGWALRGVVMRTWGDSPLKPKAQTLAGMEVDFSVVHMNFSLGILHTLSTRANRDMVYSVGLAWGF